MPNSIARPPEMKIIKTDVLVLGGGLPGICAAIQAALLGLKVTLAEKSLTLGGNCGPEIGVHPSDAHRFHPYMVSTGVVGRIIEEAAFYMAKTDSHDMHYNTSLRFDSIMTEALENAGVTILRSHYAHTPYMCDNKITAVECEDTLTYKRVRIEVSGCVIDDTGDGNISERAGATFRMGRESKDEFGEALAPEKEDKITMGASLVAVVRETKQERPFYPPENTPEFYPGYGGNCGYEPETSHSSKFFYPSETGGDVDVIEDAHEVYMRIRGHLDSAWNRLKNDLNKEELKNWEMSFVSPKLAKRESRRFNGDYMINENDVDSGRIFSDAIAVGGFATDIHYPKKENPEYVSVEYHRIPPVYTIPYRSIYSKDISNLFFASRLLSASHIAHGSIRVQRTLSGIGQAAGAAAYICRKYGITPRELYNKGYVKELQQLLLKYDATIPGIKNDDAEDKARSAKVKASSELKIRRSENIVFKRIENISGAEFWNFNKIIDKVKLLLKNESNIEIKAVVSLAKFTPEHKWQAHGERKFFDYYKYHNEAEWGSETRFKYFTELKSTEISIESNFTGFKEIYYNLELENAKDYMTDDDRLLVIISTKSMNLHLACEEKLSSYIRYIGGAETDRYKVFPYTPCIELTPDVSLGEAENIINGYNRRFSENPLNMWVPVKIPASITLEWAEAIKAKEIRITFDTLERVSHDMPYECNKRASSQCVKSFEIKLIKNNETVKVIKEDMHHNRLYVKDIDETEIDSLKLTLLEIWDGTRLPGVYEIRVY